MTGDSLFLLHNNPWVLGAVVYDLPGSVGSRATEEIAKFNTLRDALDYVEREFPSQYQHFVHLRKVPA